MDAYRLLVPSRMQARHIQDYTNATTVPYWGYASRVLPCTNDAGTCAYLEVVYNAHVIGMLYSGILWATILGIVFLWALLHYSSSRSTVLPQKAMGPEDDVADEQQAASQQSPLGGWRRCTRALSAGATHYLLPNAPRSLFGRTTRLQVAVLLALVGYLTIWSFVGIVYGKWVTPVKNMTGVYNTRTSLGAWSDRIGVLAFALTPLSILLSSRESLLSLLTGVPYQSFNFLHRWLGYVIFVQSALHTIAWTVVEARLYQPQPTVGLAWVRQTYMVWGVVAMLLLLLLVVLSTPWAIRVTGYEFFRKAHYVLAMVYIGACLGHWAQLKCFLIPSLIFWFVDRGARLLRTALLHYHGDSRPESGGPLGFRAIDASMQIFPDADDADGDVVRLELENNNQDPWQIGQHFYLCFPASSIWQSHPFTPLNNPVVRGGRVAHTYLLRAKGGETRKVAALSKTAATTPVILTGPYGEDHSPCLEIPNNNILCICGGTGITYCLPLLLELARQSTSPPSNRQIELVWVMRYAENVDWVRPELEVLRRAQSALNLRIRLFHTRVQSTTTTDTVGEKGGEVEPGSSGSSSAASLVVQGVVADKGAAGGAEDERRRPDLARLVSEFVASTAVGPSTVVASGPGGMISDLRTCVARCASGGKVWQGDERYDVRLICDDRLEW